ncbi:4-amino-4-deoxy-L-arabinose transferase [Nocardioides guangzhouensis]|uniref:4-amino-4-deoxy-L-arabinose transferase n=1 Tax=Nocardioides guangzhouensis TaxID=2497878 RepID=A0A4Q4ZDD5_9ACTN|nr:4-amino-4-deoxy-L-arabinose transferase [Nocardioides guangzhouensis]RYP86047.1 4-amino-4-deoxy-L-arabinose transferase [Nocardioides guangzhouensis]
MTAPVTSARAILDRARSRAPTLGSGRLVCVDGPAGSGKTTLADALAEVAAEEGGPPTVVHTDELLQGWRGLPGLAATLDDVLRPLAAGRPGSWRRWDWLADDWAERHPVPPGGLLVLEGVGSWARRIADLVTVLVWVEAPRDLRFERGMARDGEQMRAHWQQWMVDEDVLHAAEGTRDHADVVVDAVGRPVAR